MKNEILKTMKSCGITREAVIDSWKELVEIPSYTFQPDDVRKASVYVKERLESLGMETRFYNFEEAGPLLIGQYGRGKKSEGIILTGHIDTVIKDSAVNPCRIEGDKLYGPGVLDMKGGVNLIFYIITILKALEYTKPIKVILCGDEEHGHTKSNCDELLIQESGGYKCAFNLETGPLNGSITVARKGRIVCVITTKGISAHAGANFNEGASAIYEIAEKILRIKDLNNKYQGVTFNVGVISGGTIVNAVPDKAEIQVDIRYQDEAIADEIKKDLQEIASANSIPGTSSECIISKVFPPFVDTYNQQFFDLVRKVSEENGLGSPNKAVLGGSSDAAFISMAGVPCLCSFGVRGEWHHTDREYALIDSAMERIILTVLCILALEDTCLQ